MRSGPADTGIRYCWIRLRGGECNCDAPHPTENTPLGREHVPQGKATPLADALAGSDFRPSELYTSSQPVTVYLRWPERNLEALVRLV
ncbi:MAG: hypothetical protein M3069_05620 [Chloroflexota bacterium]|nr:hypothetical protein [Chloroflexota bacterium]